MKNNASHFRLRKNIVFALIPLVSLLIIIEVVCRVIVDGRFTPYQTNIEVQGASRYSDDPTMVWGNRPYYLEYAKRYQYNEYGIKSYPGTVKMPEKKKNDFWVFLFGGSAMAGKGSDRSQGYLNITGVTEHNPPDTIEYHLQKLLQKFFVDKNVSVFNASVAMHSVAQSMTNYERLRHLNPDWVVSMDGFNEGENSVTNSLRKGWPKHPVNTFPVKQLRIMASLSAFIFLIGEYIYYDSGFIEVPLETLPDPKIKEFWLDHPREILPLTPKELAHAPSEIKAHFKEYFRNLSLFQNMLELDKQKHLLLVQPFMIMRNSQKMPPVERAVYNYMAARKQKSSNSLDNGDYRQYMFSLLANKLSKSNSIFSMDTMHHWDGWVFVDEVHLSKEANKRIAQEISKFIISNGTSIPFP